MTDTTLVVHASRYGATEKYAHWLAEALDCPMVALRNLKDEDLARCQTLIFGGGLYAGSVRGLKQLLRRWPQLSGKRLAVYTVGLTDPASKEYYDGLASRVLSPEQRQAIRVFHLRGAIDYARLSKPHSALMGMLRLMICGKKDAERTQDDEVILASYGARVDFTDKAAVAPIAAWAQSKS